MIPRHIYLIVFLIIFFLSFNLLYSQGNFWEYRGTPSRTEIHDIDQVLYSKNILIGCSSTYTYAYDTTLGDWLRRSNNGSLRLHEGLNNRIYSVPTGKGLFYTTNSGISWISVSKFSNLDVGSVWQNRKSRTLFVGEIDFLGGAPIGHVYRSTNGGSSWTITLNVVFQLSIAFGFDSLGNTYTSTAERLYRSTDDGISWTQLTNGLPSGAPFIRTMATTSSGKFFIGSQYGLLYTTDGGSTWNNTDTSTVGRAIITKIGINQDGVIFVGTGDKGLFRSEDDGQSWVAISNGLYGISVHDLSLDSKGNMAITVTTNEREYTQTSANGGNNWNALPLVQPDTLRMSITSMVFDSTGRLFVGGDSQFGLANSTDEGSTWSIYGNPSNVNSSPVFSFNINPATGSLFCSNGQEIFRSTNSGTTWNRVLVISVSMSGFNNICITSEGLIYAHQYYAPFKYSTNNGTTWDTLTTADSSLRLLKYSNAFGMGTHNELFAAGSALPGIPIPPYFLKSVDMGSNWETSSYLPFPDHASPFRVYADSEMVFVSAYQDNSGGVYHGHGLCISSDGGYHWTHPDSIPALKGRSITCVKKDSRGNYLVALRDGGFYYSSDRGRTWLPEVTGLGGVTEVWDIVTDKTGTIFLATSSGLYASKRQLTPVVEQPSMHHMPTSFSLEQNYPNPFNPSTTISFSIKSKSFVSLKVYDVLGREVETLLSKEMQAGEYSQQWNAVSTPGGVYFYQLQVGYFSETKKLVLIK